MSEQVKSNSNSPLLSTTPSYFQVPDVATITTQMIFQTGLNRGNMADLTKKILMAFAAKYVYDNINKIGAHLFSDQTRLMMVLSIMRLLRCCRLKFKKENNELVEELSSVKLDQTRLQLALDSLDIKKDLKHGLYKLCGHWCLVHNSENQLNLYHLSADFKQQFLDSYRLSAVVGNSITTQYKMLTMSYNGNGGDGGSNSTSSSSGSSNSTSGSSSYNTMNFSWSNPVKTTKTFNDTHSDFFTMVSTFTVKSLKLKDTATQAYVINGPAGVGKTTIVDRLAAMNIINTVLKINMMNFVNYSEDFEAILNKIVCPFPVKSDNEIWLIVFDELDKWKNLWLLNRAREFVTANGNIANSSFTVTFDKLVNYLESLNNNFYNTLQRFIDGEILTKVPRLVVMALTNNGNSLWQLSVGDKVYGLPADYEAIKDRFVFFELDFCGHDEVVSYLKMQYTVLEEDYDQRLLSKIPSTIKISHRKLKQMCTYNLYDLHRIVDSLQRYHSQPNTAASTGSKQNNVCLDIDSLLADSASANSSVGASVSSSDGGSNNKKTVLNSIVVSNRGVTEVVDKNKTVPVSTIQKQTSVPKVGSNGSAITTNNSNSNKLLPTITLIPENGEDAELASLKTFDLIADDELTTRQATKEEIACIPITIRPMLSDESGKVGIDCNQKVIRMYFYTSNGSVLTKMDVVCDSSGKLLPHGEIATWHKDSQQLLSRGYYYMGKSFGPWQRWLVDGRLSRRHRTNKSGMIDGLEEEFDYNKGHRTLTEYKNGAMHGKKLIYSGNVKIYECEFASDHHISPVVEYDSVTGNRTAQYGLDDEDGDFTDVYTQYHPDGITKKLEVEYINKKKHGLQQEWDERGNLITTTKFKAGVVVVVVPEQ